MKLIKSVALLTLSSLFVFGTAQANEKKSQNNKQAKTQQTAKQPTKQTAKQPANQAEKKATNPSAKQPVKQQVEKPAVKQVAKSSANSANPAAKKEAVSKKATVPKNDVKLAEFNRNVGIKFTRRGMQMGQNNEPNATFTYVIQNKGKASIKSVNWVSGYTLNNNVFYVQEIPLNFDPELKGGTQIEMTMAVPLSKMPADAQRIFSNKESQVGAVNGAKNVVFSNGKKLVVSQ